MKKLISSIVFLLLAAFLALSAYRVLSWKDTTGGYLSSMQQLQATEKDQIDLAFLGSSHIYCDVNIAQIWNETGISAFDMSVSGMDAISMPHYLKELFKEQSPSVVCIELYQTIFKRQPLLSNVYRLYLSLPLSPGAVEAILEYGPEDPMAYITRWPIIHTRYRELTAFDFVQYQPSVFGRGFSYHYEMNPVAWDGQNDAESTTPLSEENKELLDELLAICNENGSQMVGIMTPIVISDEDQKIINGAKEYLAAQGVPILDMNTDGSELGLDPHRDFTDEDHLNYWGSQKATAHLTDWLTQRFSFPDHRGDEAYSYWTQAAWYDLYQQKSHVLVDADKLDPIAVLEAANSPGLTLVITLSPDYTNPDPRWKELLQQLGVPPEQIEQGGQWMLCEGYLLHYQPPGTETRITVDLDKVHTISFAPGVPFGADNCVTIDNEACHVVADSLSIVIYDNYECKMLYALNF